MDDLTPPQERAVRVALTAARYRTALAAAGAEAARLAVEIHRLAVTLQGVLDPQTGDDLGEDDRYPGEVWVDFPPPGGWVCKVCGTPTESEPCPDHMPDPDTEEQQ